MTTRPSFSMMRQQFSVIYADGDIAWVGEKIGGKVGENIALGKTDASAGFTNACAIRLSYSLNYSGSPVGRGSWSTVSGADKKLYIFRIRDLLPYLRQRFGRPDKTVKNPKESDFAGMQGILVFSVPFETRAVTRHSGTAAPALITATFPARQRRQYGF